MRAGGSSQERSFHSKSQVSYQRTRMVSWSLSLSASPSPSPRQPNEPYCEPEVTLAFEPQPLSDRKLSVPPPPSAGRGTSQPCSRGLGDGHGRTLSLLGRPQSGRARAAPWVETPDGSRSNHNSVTWGRNQSSEPQIGRTLTLSSQGCHGDTTR